MNFQALKDLTLSSFNDVQLYSDGLFSEAVFKTIRETQREARCSVFNYTFTISESTTKINLTNIPYSLVSGDYGYSDLTDPDVTAVIHAVFVENIWEVDGTTETWLLGIDKNDFDREDDHIENSVAVGYDKSGMSIFFDRDMNGKTVKVRVRFVADYVEGEYAVGDRVNLFLNMIPTQFHAELVEGVRGYFYRALYTQTGRKDFLRQAELNEEQWRSVNLPLIRAQVNEILTDGVVFSPKPQRITSLDRT